MDDRLYTPSVVFGVLAFSSPGIAMAVAGSTVRYAPYSYAFGFTSCALWIAFGFHYQLGTLGVLSSYGALAYAGYLAAFLWNCDDAHDARRGWLLRYVIPGSAAVLFAGLLLRLFASQADFDNFCSTVASLASAAPLWNVPAVYRTKTTDSMPSWIVAGFMLFNAAILTYRNIVGVKHVNLNLAIPACIALSSAVVQLLLHLVCWCLPRPPLLPSAVDDTPLLRHHQAEDNHAANLPGGSGRVDGVGRGLGLGYVHGGDGVEEDNETRMDVTSLQEQIAHAKKNEIDNSSLRQDGHHEIAHAKNEIDDLSDLLHQDGHHEDEIAHANNEIENVQLPQDGQNGGQAEKKEEPTDLVALVRQEKDKDQAVAEVKPAQNTVTSDSEENVDPAVPQQGEKA